MNIVLITGNVGRDPETRYTPSGKMVSTFSIANEERYKKNGEVVKNTQWFNVETWGGLAEWASSGLPKGARVLIEGRLKIDKYEEEGATKYFTKIVAKSVEVQKWPNRDGGDDVPGWGDGEDDDNPFAR